ncbi:MAG: amidohydrolase family protein [Ancalomicrobiaceae bacterium]|nr:amidohydrolase family protein [Ancalomicrobiaceae bacterium]
MGRPLLIRNARLADGRLASLIAEDGAIRDIGAELTPPEGAIVEDAAGHLLLPGFVEAHVHLDKTLMGLPFIPHIPGGSVAERIAAEKTLRRGLTIGVEERGGRLIEQLVAYGTVALRSHVDIDSEVGLKGLEAVLALRERYRDLIDIETVAFPQSGILRDPGTAGMLDAAMAAGADLVGGLDPAGIDGDVAGHLGIVFGLAEKHGKGIDIHLHDGGALGAFELRQIALRTLAAGLEGRVVVSHAFCLGELGHADFAATAGLLAKAEIAIMTTAPGPVPMPPVKRLMAAGVRVISGSDNIRDAWSPFGNGDLLERAGIVCDRQDFRDDADLELAFSLVTDAPSRVIGRGPAVVAVGAPADFVLVAASSVAETVAKRPTERTVFKRGRKVAAAGELIGWSDG